MPSFWLYRTWYPHFMTTFTIYDITCTIFIPSHALYMTSHLLCMMSHSLFVLHHAMTLSMASNTICLCYIHLIWHQGQCCDHKTIVCLPRHYAWHYTQCIFDITHNIPNFEKKWMYVITASICMTPYTLHMTSHPLFMTSHHCSYHITSTALRTSHTQ